MYRKTFSLLFLLNFVFFIFPQENVMKPNDDVSNLDKGKETIYQSDKNTKSYLISISLRIADNSDNVLLNSSWSRFTLSGKPLALNLKANNLAIIATFIPYYVDEDSVMLLVHGKVIIRPVQYAEGRYYSTVDSLPLKIGEKALFFPLGMTSENGNVSCVLEIEVQHNNKGKEKLDKEKDIIDPESGKNNKRNDKSTDSTKE